MLSIFCDIDTIYFFYDFSLYFLKNHDKLWYHNNCRCVVLKMCEACCMSSQSRYKFWVIKSVPEAKSSIQPELMLVFLIYMKWLGVWLFPLFLNGWLVHHKITTQHLIRLPWQFHWYPFMLLGREWHCERIVFLFKNVTHWPGHVTNMDPVPGVQLSVSIFLTTVTHLCRVYSLALLDLNLFMVFYLFRIVRSLQSDGVMVSQVACGARHSLALSTGKH